MAAINAKQSGDIDQAKQHYVIAKVTGSIAVWSHIHFHDQTVLTGLSSVCAETGCAGGGIGQR